METKKMMARFEQYGCDMDGIRERLLEDDALCVSCMQTFSEEKSFELLGKLLKQERYTEAFDCVHMLKGVAANLGLTPLLSRLSDLTERLRSKNYSRIDTYYAACLEEFHRFCNLFQP